ncbi:MAG: hypothetical protein R8J84_04425 [Mariprofundales bacterium]
MLKILDQERGITISCHSDELLLLNDPIQGRKMMRHLAGLEPNDRWLVEWQQPKATTIRYWFDCWPPPWMGLTVGEELAFGLDESPAAAEQVLAQWHLDPLPLNQSTLELERFDAVRLMLAHAELAHADLLLLEQPDAGLSSDQRQQLFTLIQAWLSRSGAMAIATSVNTPPSA